MLDGPGPGVPNDGILILLSEPQMGMGGGEAGGLQMPLNVQVLEFTA